MSPNGMSANGMAPNQMPARREYVMSQYTPHPGGDMSQYTPHHGGGRGEGLQAVVCRIQGFTPHPGRDMFWGFQVVVCRIQAWGFRGEGRGLRCRETGWS